MVKRAKKYFNIGLEEELHTKAKVIAVLKNMTLNDFIEKAITEAVEKDKGVLDKLK
jgi:predicted HicB family RNase H-like nuclease